MNRQATSSALQELYWPEVNEEEAAAVFREQGPAYWTPRPWARPPLTRLRLQVPLLLLVAILLPAALLQQPEFWHVTSGSSVANSALMSVTCALVSLWLFRRLEQFPGISRFHQVAPSILATYALMGGGVLLARFNYSRPFLLLSAAACFAAFAGLWIYYRRKCRYTVYVLPGAALGPSPRLEVLPISAPPDEIERNALVAADLSADLTPAWQRFVLGAALAGIPVFDAKALEEASTGRVEIEHLSENTFGSVLPSLAYLKIKRVVDLTTALLVLPLLLPLFAVAALCIKLESPGSVFFRQARVGFRGKTFMVMKFRTMRHCPAGAAGGSAHERISSAMTKSGDDRITRVGRFLRRHRIDELPQIFNIIKGEMSWIGPRPEADLLSKWYNLQIPFYGYRHVVRPGITGWAQVNQGHVVDVTDVTQKLHYDFYYIKNFSAWLDLHVAARTVAVLLMGHGSK